MAETGLQKWVGMELVGNYRDPQEITHVIQQAKLIGHLISPDTQCSYMPDGWSVSVSVCYLDPDPKSSARDVYVESGGLALTKHGLEKIAGIAGVDWDYAASGRTDDRSNKSYCEWKAVGKVRDLMGNVRHLNKTREIDLSPPAKPGEAGGAEYESICKKAAEAKDYNTKKPAPRDPTNELIQARRHIASKCETMAQNRAVRSLGLNATYTKDELAKPFVIVKLEFTGQSNNPEMQNKLTLMKAASALGGLDLLFGAQQRISLDAPQQQAALSGEVADDSVKGEIVEDHDEDNQDESGDEDPFPEKPVSAGGSLFDNTKGIKYSELPMEELKRQQRIYEGITDPSKRAKAEAELKVILDVLASRE